jgi:hypothetical protein
VSTASLISAPSYTPHPAKITATFAIFVSPYG